MAITTFPTTLYFDGNSHPGSFVPLSSTVMNFPASGTAFSCGAIVNLRKKQTTIQNDDHCLFFAGFNYGGNAGAAFYVAASNGSVNFFIGQTLYTSPTGLFTYEVPHQVTFTVDTTTTAKCYIDGVLVWTQTIVRLGAGNGTFNTICQEGNRFRGLYGTIREVFIKRALLSQADATSIAAETYDLTTTDLYYKCNEGVGSAIRDFTSNRNFGIIWEDGGGGPFPWWKNSSRRTLIF